MTGDSMSKAMNDAKKSKILLKTHLYIIFSLYLNFYVVSPHILENIKLTNLTNFYIQLSKFYKILSIQTKSNIFANRKFI